MSQLSSECNCLSMQVFRPCTDGEHWLPKCTVFNLWWNVVTFTDLYAVDVATSMHKLINHSCTNDEMFKCVNMLSYSPCFTADHILPPNHIFANFIISSQVLELDLELGHSCMIDKIPGSH